MPRAANPPGMQQNTPNGFRTQPKNTLPAITEIWAFVSVDPSDGNEGIMSMQFGTVHMPLIAADKARLKDFWPIAQRIAREHNQQIRLVRLDNRTVVADDVRQDAIPWT